MDDVVYCAADECLRYEGERAGLCRCTAATVVFILALYCVWERGL